ncbi:uncharacterized protein roh isoform X4 [Panulirus ornatus]|uniref:uncharacterized protein roh isoform X4 n=1 Tax=Panulirus ornatus TaxID=150431 RepID=UPI003A848FC0
MVFRRSAAVWRNHRSASRRARSMSDNKGQPNSASSNPFENLVNRLKPDKMSGRTMKFPYTFSSKVALFPYNYYFKNVWFVRYYIVGATLCIPVFTWIQKQACSPANVAAFEAKKAAEGH